MIRNDKFILLAVFTLTLWLAAPSLLLDIAGLGQLKPLIGKGLLILCIVVLIVFNNAKLSRSALLLSSIVFIYGLALALTYTLAGLHSSVAPIFGATIKVVLFIIIVAVSGRHGEAISKAVSASIFPLLVLALVSILVHNIINIPELFRIVVNDRQISVLVGSFSTSRIFIGDVPLYRLSSIFYEPGNYGLILYCLFLFFVTGREFSSQTKLILALNLINTFSLGAFLSIIVSAISYIKPRVIWLNMRRVRLLKVMVFLISFGTVLYFITPGIRFIISRLSLGTNGRLFAGDNRFFDDKLPQNYILGDGSMGGGFDSIISIFQQYGILGCLILFAPIIIVAGLLILRHQLALGVALLMFLAHKPNILTPIILILLAVVASRLWQKQLGTLRPGSL